MRVVSTTFDLPDNQLTEIGRVCVFWSHLEWQFEDCIRLLSGTGKERNRIMTQGMNLRSRIIVIRGLMQEQGLVDKLAGPFEKIAKEITEKHAEGQRNTVVHSLWHFSKEPSQWYAVMTAGSWSPGTRGRIRRSVLPQSIPMGQPELVGICNRIVLIMGQMDMFRQSLRNALAASPEKS